MAPRPFLAITTLLSILLLASCAARNAVPALSQVVVARASAADFPAACVAADHFIASAAGAEMLARGGNAIDAAVATSFTLSVVRPYSCGIGGGGFMVICLAPDRSHPSPREIAINYRETTPAAIDPLYYERRPEPDASTHGGAAAGVPGTVAGLLYALDNFGTLPRETVLAPAIRAAHEGFHADADFIGIARAITRRFDQHPDWKTRFAFVWTRYLKEGRVQLDDLITNPEQAAALGLIARDGADAFYRGPIAHAIVETVRADRGVISPQDLAGFAPVQVSPLRFAAFGHTFLTIPPPSSGGIAMAETLGVLELCTTRETAALSQHILVESFKHAFADRARWLADPAFEPVPIDRLTSREYLATLARRVHADRTLTPADYGSHDIDQPAPPPPDHGTSHLSVVDRHGNAVACTETINLEFGSLLAVAQYGFCLNNEMDDFLTRRGEPNAFNLHQSDRNLPAPGKRPLSSMSPTIVLDGDRVIAVAGASGGPRIITATTQVLLNSVVHGMNARDAVAAPRLHHQWMPDTLLLEEKWRAQPRSEALIEALRGRGHTVSFTDSLACVQIIRRAPDGKSWQAASDPRKGVRPAGH